MSAAMDNLLKMFKAARETTCESSGTAPSAADVEALPKNPDSILTAEEIQRWPKEFDLPAGMKVRAPYKGLADEEGLTVSEEDFQALYFLKQNPDSKGRFAFMKMNRNSLKFEEITNSVRH
ncbi:hypothetical protein TIFTF001_029910 [Ficus carica]|uniref:Uncharacterized protein n=1 Tax=Ficus carica TaxID=3494 RepID=A0AA88DSQ1_FICCA|nr:hypothetical protein TIFTF001_029910 [Ficus carica]